LYTAHEFVVKLFAAERTSCQAAKRVLKATTIGNLPEMFFEIPQNGSVDNKPGWPYACVAVGRWQVS
jgi:hypothetical protein